ncbi:MAG: DDE-type integrase/transposase/recombinase [Candidatus Lokiarchaeota archaeon]|nr:DDE-type integrase/transposase/recombinase [Candidatus Lokiarchaeota archaeon]
MAGRKKKVLTPIYRDLIIIMKGVVDLMLGQIQIKCPLCGSWKVTTNGTRPRKGKRVEAFICRNKKCKNGDHKTPKSFILTTSYEFKQLIFTKLERLYGNLLKDGAKCKTVAKKYKVSPSQISKLRDVFIEALDKLEGLDKLVKVPQSDRTICMDETFLKIEGTSVYIIVATGYKTHKILGLKVSKSRKEKDMREVFDEAEKNTKERISNVISDGWGATQKMTKNLRRKITHVIHKHKKPYKKVLARHYFYTRTRRITLEIGIKNDLFKKRGKRVFYYAVSKKPLNPLPPKKLGRPKGSKNKSKNKKKSVKNNKPGKRGLLKVFYNGKRGYVKVDPYRLTLKFSKTMDPKLISVLTDLLELFFRKTIQNNVGEGSNSVLQSLLKLCGPKTISSVEDKIRAFAMIRNRPELLSKVQIDRNIRGTFISCDLITPELAHLMNQGCTLQIK